MDSNNTYSMNKDELVYRLACLYNKEGGDVAVAEVCDGCLDRSGALLGYVRDMSYSLKSSEPMHCIEIPRVEHLIDVPVLYAEDKEGLGYYGTVIGKDEKSGKIRVKNSLSGKTALAPWIVRHKH